MYVPLDTCTYMYNILLCYVYTKFNFTVNILIMGILQHKGNLAELFGHMKSVI